ncbi:MAG: hypothetical protein AAF497_24865, partial [Planctomycetota bacterium]
MDARDASRTRAFSGGVNAFGETTGFGFGGAYAGNHVDQDVYAFVESSEMTTLGAAAITARSDMSYQALSLGGSQQNIFTLALNISENKVNRRLKANTQDATISANGDIRLEAEDNSIVGAYGADFAYASIAVGASIGLNEITANIESRGVDSTLSSESGSVLLDSRDETSLTAVAVGGAFAQWFSVGGSYSQNEIETSLDSELYGSTVSANGGIQVSADNSSSIFALAGGLAGSDIAGFGVSIGNNLITNNVSSNITRTSAQAVDGDVTVLSTNSSDIQSIAVGGAGAGTVGVGISLPKNEIDSTVHSHIIDSNVVAFGDVDVEATNNDKILAISGGAAGAGVFALGAAYSENQISADVEACIHGSTVTSIDAGIQLQTTNSSNIESIAAGIAGAGTVAVGGSIAINRVDVDLCTCVIDSTLMAVDDVVLAANEYSNVRAITGGAAGSGVVAVGAAVSDNKVNRTVKSEMTDSDVTSSAGSVIVRTGGRSTQTATSIGIAGSGAVSVSPSIVTNHLNQDVKSSINGDSDVFAGRHVQVLSQYSNTIKSTVIAAAGSGAAAGAGTVGNVKVDQTMEASIGTGTEVYATGNVLVAANDNTNVESWVGAASGSGGGSVGGSI